MNVQRYIVGHNRPDGCVRLVHIIPHVWQFRLLAARLTHLLFELSIESPLARSKTSSNWLKEHFDDPYVKQAQKDGYRSRASYKLLEISKKDRLLRPGMTVVDLGAAPGGWTQVAMQLVGEECA